MIWKRNWYDDQSNTELFFNCEFKRFFSENLALEINVFRQMAETFPFTIRGLLHF